MAGASLWDAAQGGASTVLEAYSWYVEARRTGQTQSCAQSEAPVSTRRKAGELVWKIANAGFVGQPGRIRLCAPRPGDFDPTPPCLGLHGCVDPRCVEWADCEALGDDGSVIGMCCHVSECEMEDLP